MHLKALRGLSWREFCENLDSDPPNDLQKKAEEYFFSEIAPEAKDLFFEKIAEIVQLYEASLFAPDFRKIAEQKTSELFAELLPLYEVMHPALKARSIDPETANFLLVCAYLRR